MFFLLSSVVAGLGALYAIKPKFSILAYLLLIAVIPTGNSFNSIIYLGGVYFFDFYPIFAVVSLFFAGGSLFLEPVARNKSALFFVFALLFLALIRLTYDNVDIIFLKDFRPLLYVVNFTALALIFCRMDIEISKNTANILLTIAFLFNFLDQALVYNGVFSSSDEFYESNSYRYIDAATYMAVIYVLFFLSGGIKISKYDLFVFISAVACIILSNSRFVLLSIVFSIILAGVSDFRKMIIYLIVSSALLWGFWYVSFEIGAERVINSFNSQELAHQIDSRFSPALDVIDNFGLLNHFFGAGFGSEFEIPWFAYRGLSVFHVNIDSTYLTFYAKYGALSILLIFWYTHVMTGLASGIYRHKIWIFLGVMYFVSATAYQSFSMGVFIGIFLVEAIIKHEKKNP